MSFDTERRDFLTVLGGAAAWPFAACAQPVDRVRRIGVLMTGPAGDRGAPSYIRAFQETLEKLGWIVGRNFQVDHRWRADEVDVATVAAREFLSLRPDVIVAAGRLWRLCGMWRLCLTSYFQRAEGMFDRLTALAHSFAIGAVSVVFAQIP